MYDRPHPDPLPQERETPWRSLGHSEVGSTNPALGSRKRLETILLLLGEKAGMRADNSTNFHAILLCVFINPVLLKAATKGRSN